MRRLCSTPPPPPPGSRRSPWLRLPGVASGSVAALAALDGRPCVQTSSLTSPTCFGTPWTMPRAAGDGPARRLRRLHRTLLQGAAAAPGRRRCARARSAGGRAARARRGRRCGGARAATAAAAAAAVRRGIAAARWAARVVVDAFSVDVAFPCRSPSCCRSFAGRSATVRRLATRCSDAPASTTSKTRGAHRGRSRASPTRSGARRHLAGRTAASSARGSWAAAPPRPLPGGGAVEPGRRSAGDGGHRPTFRSGAPLRDSARPSCAGP